MRIIGIIAMLAVRMSIGLASVSAAETNPLGKVFDLMAGLRSQIVKEGETEAKAYRTFVAWCDEASQSTGFEIKTASAKKEKLEAKILELKSDIEVGTAKIEDLSEAVGTAEAELKEATAIREQEASDFAASEKELMATVGTLERAVEILEKEMGKNGAALAQLDTTNLESIVRTLNVVVSAAAFSAADRQKLTSLVQSQQQEENDDEDELGASAAAKSASKSGSIVEVLEDLKEKAENELASARKAEMEAKHNYEMLKQSLTDKFGADMKDMRENKAGVAAAKEEMGGATGDLSVTVKDLKNAETALAMTKKDCMRTAGDHEATVQSREEELKVIAEAQKILKESTGQAETQTYSLLQVSSQMSAKMRSRVDLAYSEVIEIVKKLAHAEHSAALNQLSSRITAVVRYGSSGGGDPFAKVKGMISEMLSKLEKEAEEAATEKAYCDEQLSSTKKQKESLESDVQKLTSQIDKAAARAAQLKEEIAELQAELAATAKIQNEMDSVRKSSNADYLVAKKELTEGLGGVRRALGVLRDYYGGSAASASLLQNDDEFGAAMQQPQPPVKHKKSSGAGSGIIDILEVCESNFATNLAKEETEEADEAASYEEVTNQNKLSTQGKTQDVEFKTKEAASLDKTIADKSGDRDSVVTELKAVLEYDGKLKQRCIAKPASYEERKKQREAELKGLREALSVLEGAAAFLQKKHRMRHRHSHFMAVMH